MMTPEEAIEVLENGGWWDSLIPVTTIEGRIEDDKLHEALDLALSALRPVSREQVEKVWPGCVVCKNAKYVTGAVSAVAPHDAHHEIETDAEGDFDFCPVCGRPLTDEAVEIRLKELEALNGEKESD